MTLPAVITAMLRPDFYPQRPPEVTLAQTHISYVLLAGNDVYKLKKPVRFSFLDFSTLALRRHFCQEEVRLNRRLAPDVYRGVVAICAQGGGYRLGPEGDAAAVDYAVYMRRLPQDRMLDRLLNQHAVTRDMIDAVAARLATFHAAADAGSEVTANGAPAAVWRILEDNFVGVRPFRDQIVPAGDDDAIQAFARDFLQRNAALFSQRQAERRIRECHGDLHSEHLCFDTELVIFDCIEFNPQFRYCDVASEIAFLAMDLDYQQQPDLAAHLVARYEAHANDPTLPRLVPFYQCYRAYVRGKVDSLTSAEEEIPPAERKAARQRATRHFALAYRYTWAYSPCLVVVAGLSGTGKSAIAAALHTRTGFAHLNADVIRKQLAGVPPNARRTDPYDAGLYTPKHSERTYREMYTSALAQLAAGRGVILDATFQRRADRDAARALAARAGAPLLIVECRCAEDEVHRRLTRRVSSGEGPSDADWNIYLRQRQRCQPFTADEGAQHLVIDTTTPIAQGAGTVEAELRRRLR